MVGLKIRRQELALRGGAARADAHGGAVHVPVEERALPGRAQGPLDAGGGPSRAGARAALLSGQGQVARGGGAPAGPPRQAVPRAMVR